MLPPPPQTGRSSNANNNNTTSNVNGSTTLPLLPTPSKEPVLSEYYDEIVFTDPTEAFHQQLQRAEIMPRLTVTNTECAPYWKRPSDDNDIKSLIAAQGFLDHELLNVKERILKAEEEKVQLEDQIRTVTAQAQAATAAIATKVHYYHPPPSVAVATASTTTTTTAIPLSTPSVTPMIPSTLTTATSIASMNITTNNSNKSVLPSNNSTVNSAAVRTSSANTLCKGSMGTDVGITTSLKLPLHNNTSHSAYEAREVIGGKSASIKGKKIKTAASSSSSGSAKRSKAISAAI